MIESGRSRLRPSLAGHLAPFAAIGRDIRVMRPVGDVVEPAEGAATAARQQVAQALHGQPSRRHLVCTIERPDAG